MRHQITFRLVNPNLRKWHQYTSLMPTIDKICKDQDLIIERRTTDIRRYEITEIVVVNCQKKLFTAKHKIVGLLQRNQIETIIVSMNVIASPLMKTNHTYWRLQELHQSEINMNRWISVMKNIDSYARSYNVIIQRVIDRDNFACKISYDYIEDWIPEVITFYAGQILADTNIFLDHDVFPETSADVKTDDLFMELDEITKEHRQMSFL